MFIISLVLAALAVGAAAVNETEWSRFRGPNGAGVAEQTALPTEFGPEQNVIWKTGLPPGHSSPVLSGDRLFVTAFEGEGLLTIALDRATGVIVWRSEVPRRHTLPVDKRNHPASPTPAADGENVYVFFQDFGLVSYDRQGRERWRMPLGPFNNAYGMAASPIVVDGSVVLICDQSTGSFMIAVDKDTGTLRWRHERPEAKTGHSTPIVYRPPNEPAQLLVPGSFYLTAYAAATGEKLWWVQGLAFEMKATPVIQEGVVYIHGTSSSQFKDGYERKIPSFAELSGEYDKDKDGRFAPEEIPDPLAKRWIKLLDLDADNFLSQEEWAYYQAARRSQGGMWAFKLGGRGDMTEASTLWHYDRSVPQLPSPLVYRGVLYMVNDGGIMTALDPGTGKSLAQSRLRGAVDAYYASPVAADGKIIVVSESGTVAVLRADGALTLLAVNNLDDLCYATPAIAGGRLYIRTRGMLYAFGLRQTGD
ncbi:MAG: PQQ-binding-like beta-propeller repeat protein [Vicinamibacterales bacterium]